MPDLIAKRTRRMNDILDAVTQRGSVSVDALATMTGASHATIRRDLAELAEQGLLVRTHGRALTADGPVERPEALRDARFAESKRRIAAAAARLIPPGPRAIAVGGGTTTAEFVRELSVRDGVTIITNSLSIARIASERAGCAVMMTGGRLRPRSFELVGALAERAFAVAGAAVAVLGADGVGVAGGVTTHDAAEARTNHAMLASARRAVVVADGSKIGRAAGACIAAVSEIDVLVTDATADAAELGRLRDAGVRVVVAAEPTAEHPRRTIARLPDFVDGVGARR